MRVGGGLKACDLVQRDIELAERTRLCTEPDFSYMPGMLVQRRAEQANAITFHAGRGMSRARLVGIYGTDLVNAVLGTSA